MGSSLSRPFVPDTSDGTTTNMCLMAFPARFAGDELTLLYGNSDLHANVKAVIQRSWRKGIKQEKEYFLNFSGFEFKGSPFTSPCCGSTERAFQRSVLLSGIIQDMMSRGWSLRCTTNFKPHTKSTSFLFEHVLDANLEPNIVVVDLQSSDMLFLVNGSSRLSTVIENIIAEEWGLSKRKLTQDGHYSFKLNRFPWSTNSVGKGLAKSRYVMLQVLKAVHNEGYTFIGAGHPQHGIQEVDTIFFARTVNHEPMRDCFIFGMQKADYLYVVDAPDSCVQIVKDAIENVWPKGMQRAEEVEEKMAAFKMKGYPWDTSGNTATDARKTLLHIFEKFRSIGWRIYATFDMNVNLNDTCCFMMTSCPPSHRKYMAVKLGCGNTFRLINAPENVKSSIKNLMYKFWAHGLPENQLDDNPHFSFPRGLYNVQGVFTFIVEKIESLGWRLVSSADISQKFHADKNSRYPIDVHTLFFEQTEESIFS